MVVLSYGPFSQRSTLSSRYFLEWKCTVFPVFEILTVVVKGFDRSTRLTVLVLYLYVPVVSLLTVSSSRGESEFGGGGGDGAGWLPEHGFAIPTRLVDVVGEGTRTLVIDICTWVCRVRLRYFCCCITEEN